MNVDLQLARIAPDNADRLRQAREQWGAGRYDLAIIHLMNIRADGHLRASISFTIAIASLKMSRHDAAFGRLEAAADVIDEHGPCPTSLITLSENDPDYQFARGYVMRTLGRLDEAHAALQTSLNARPDDPYTVYQLGLVFVAVGDQAAAREAYVLLSRLDEQLAHVLYDQIHF